MNVHSLFFRLNLFFLIAVILLGVLFVYVKRNEEFDIRRQVVYRTLEMGRMIRHSHIENRLNLKAMANDAGFELVAKNSLPALTPVKLLIPRKRHIRSYVDEDGKYYFLFHRGNKELLFKDTHEYKKTHISNIVFLFLFLGLLILYLTMRNSLSPLKKLSEKIRSFANGDKEVSTVSNRKDEIALISNEFNDAVMKIRQLESTRKLFWRNIMHELKTPLTKGKLALAMFEENKDTEYLNRVFDRMNELINQVASIEKLDHVNFTKIENSVEEIVQKAIEHQYLQEEEKKIELNIVEDTTIGIDQELFLSAIGNLVDNALKYATSFPIEIIIEKHQLCIINEGSPMQNSFEMNKGAFISENSKDGFGLGLYISDAIIRKHGFRLNHTFYDNKHTMCIEFES